MLPKFLELEGYDIVPTDCCLLQFKLWALLVEKSHVAAACTWRVHYKDGVATRRPHSTHSIKKIGLLHDCYMDLQIIQRPHCAFQPTITTVPDAERCNGNIPTTILSRWCTRCGCSSSVSAYGNGIPAEHMALCSHVDKKYQCRPTPPPSRVRGRDVTMVVPLYKREISMSILLVPALLQQGRFKMFLSLVLSCGAVVGSRV